MNLPCWRLTVRSCFSAAHALRNYKGKCENLHGHNYLVEMTAEGTALDEQVEYLADFSVLKEHLNGVLELLDHANLNERAPFAHINATSENLARYIYQRLTQRLAELPVKLYSVTVWETEKQGATYMEVPSPGTGQPIA